ncbi:MAG TPA: PaaI family thioesterase [Candidatus Limnocylindrales bacterium]
MTSEAGTFGDVRIAGRRVMLEPHNCFACGTLNAHGLHLALHAGDGRCWVDVTLDSRFEGWEGIAHGGIISTILDEVMAWAVVEHDLWGVTARISIEYKHPVPIGRPIHGEGRVTSVRRRIVETEGTLTDEDGNLLARAEATFVGAPEDKKAELKARYGFVLVRDDVTAAPPDMVDAE